MLDVRRLRLLVELSRRGTLAAVADALNYSPSSVSEQLKVLERETGVQLLEQAGRRVLLTPQAWALVEHGEAILDRLEEAQSAMSSTVASVGGTVRIGVFQSAAHALLPNALAVIARDHPGLRVEATERAPEDGLFEVAARGFDLAVAEQYPGTLRPKYAELDHVTLAMDPIHVALPSDDRAESLTELADRAWVMEPTDTASRQWVMQICRAAGFEPDVRFETSDLMAHVRLIRAGHAVGMLPDLVWAGEVPSVHLLPIPGAPQREVFSSARRAAAARPAVQAVRAAFATAATTVSPIA